MAQLLSSRYSAERCMNSGRRHQRLSKQVVNDERLSNQIQPAMDDCKLKLTITDQKAEIREDAYDDLVLADRFLDDEIRSLYDSCKKYDRDHPGALVLMKIFPAEKFGDIVRLPFAVEAGEAEKIALRIEHLGAEHDLSVYLSTMNTKINAVKKALDRYHTAIRNEKMAEAEVVIAKEVLVSKYEANYLDARRKYGKSTCDKLFPKTTIRNTSTEQDDLDNDPEL